MPKLSSASTAALVAMADGEDPSSLYKLGSGLDMQIQDHPRDLRNRIDPVLAKIVTVSLLYSLGLGRILHSVFLIETGIPCKA